MKSQIFIGSSSESKNIAEVIKGYLEPKYECTVWYEGFFEQNTGTYENLVNQAPGFDYAVFIAGPDDFVYRKSKNTAKKGARDNVYLEFGLYAGILSPSRTFFFVDQACTIASDFAGITVYTYTDISDIAALCAQLDDDIKKEERRSRISVLPSSSLAIGYFENFLKPVSKSIFDLQSIRVDGIVYDVKDYPKYLEIVIPDTVEEDWKSWTEVYYRQNRLKKISLDSEIRDLDVRVDVDVLKNDKKLRLVDVPQTLRSSFFAAEIIMGDRGIGDTAAVSRAKKKEANNFVHTLKILQGRDSFVKGIVKIGI